MSTDRPITKVLEVVVGVELFAIAGLLLWLDTLLFRLNWFANPPWWTLPVYIPFFLFLLLAPFFAMAFGVDHIEGKR